MIISRHAIQRCSQRGIRKAMIELYCRFGTQVKDKIYFGKKEKQYALKYFKELNNYDNIRSISTKQIIKSLIQHNDSQVLVLVVEDNTVITTYKRNSKKEKKYA